jgi:DNA-binding transcriptional LysR family regulator
MQTKWLEDLIALSHTGSLTRAAEQRHVTHPAFGRRIKALEAWAGAPLIERRGTSVKLTGQGEKLLGYALQMVPALAQARSEIAGADGERSTATVTLSTGRTLARTVAADWLARIRRQRAGVRVVVRTGSMAETLQRFERGEADFMLTYHHPQIALRLSSHQYLQRRVASDRLVPVGKVNALGQAAFGFEQAQPVPYLAYADTLALGRLVRDHLSNHPKAPRLVETVEGGGGVQGEATCAGGQQGTGDRFRSPHGAGQAQAVASSRGVLADRGPGLKGTFRQGHVPKRHNAGSCRNQNSGIQGEPP